VQSDAADFNPYGTAAVAGLVGIFSKQATDKLEEVFTNLFRTEPGKGDDERRNKLHDAVPVADQMVPLRKMRKVVLATEQAERDVQAERNIKLSDLLKITNEGFTRVPILDKKNLCRYVVHQSLIYKFMARRVIDGEPPEKLDPRTVTLEDFLAFDDVMNYVHDALAFVPSTATLGDAQAAMEKDKDCQDILVTKTGTREGEVLGWLTNIDIARHIKA
jgi:hypothetical protein